MSRFWYGCCHILNDLDKGFPAIKLGFWQGCCQRPEAYVQISEIEKTLLLTTFRVKRTY